MVHHSIAKEQLSVYGKGEDGKGRQDARDFFSSFDSARARVRHSGLHAVRVLFPRMEALQAFFLFLAYFLQPKVVDLASTMKVREGWRRRCSLEYCRKGKGVDCFISSEGQHARNSAPFGFAAHGLLARALRRIWGDFELRGELTSSKASLYGRVHKRKDRSLLR